MRIFKQIFVLSIACLLLLSACKKEESKPIETKTVSLGAYYFLESLDKDSLRQKLVPPQEPVLGDYNMRDEAVIRQHFTWIKQAGIDFLVMHWWGKDTPSDVTIRKHFIPYFNQTKDQTKFCISYMTPYIHGAVNYQTQLDQSNEAAMLVNFIHLAKTYFNHPNYFRINNKPVVFLYLSRFLKGNYAKSFGRLRSILMQQTKEDLYLVGDEIFWTEPERTRIAELDAITNYTMYGPSKYAGYAGENEFLDDLSGVFDRYKKAAESLNVGFIPNVMPGFNDRAVAETDRLEYQEKHYIIPRLFSINNQREGSFYQAYFNTSKRYLDSKLNMIVINSWNGWRTDTQIEPVKTAEIPSRYPEELTGGYEYNTYGETYLSITRDEKVFALED